MDPTLRIVGRLPLSELWTEHGPLAAARRRSLSRADVKALLQAGPVRFVVADVGRPLRWIPEEERLVFWKADARSHIPEHPDLPLDLYLYPEGYAYVASEWDGDALATVPIIALEHHH